MFLGAYLILGEPSGHLLLEFMYFGECTKGPLGTS